MPWMLPAVVASLGGSLILCGVFAYLYVQYRERHMGIWAWGWFFYALRFVFTLCQLSGVYPREMSSLIQMGVLVSGLFLLWGTNVFVARRTSPIWLAGGLACAGWIALSRQGDFSFLAQTLPVFFFYAVISIRTGFTLLLAEGLEGAGKRLTGWGLILWGIHKADYPFLRPVEWFAPWGFLLGSLFSFGVAMGMLLIYFQKVRRELGDRETALRSSQDHHRTLLQTIPYGVTESDREGRITFANDTYCRMRGLEREEIVGKSFWEMVVLPEEREKLRRKFLSISREMPEPEGFVVKNLDAAGRTVYRQMDWDYLRGEGGEIAGFVCVVTDITDRQKAEEELRAANRTLEGLFREAPLPIVAFDREEIVTHWNPAAERVLGWQVEEVIGRPYPLVPSGQREGFEEHLEVVFRGENIGGVDTRRLTKAGDEIDVRISSAPIHDGGGRIAGAIAILEDFTERKRVERALRASEENYRNLAEMSPVPMFVHRGGVFQYLNPAAVALFGGGSADRLVGRSVLDWIHPDDRSQRRDEQVRAAPSPHEKRRFQFRIVRPGRQERELDVTVLPIDYGGGAGCLTICLDVTERKMAEAALERKRALLQTILDAIPAPIFYKDAEGVYLGCNRAFEDYLGRPRTQIVGKGVHEIAPTELADIYFEADKALLVQGGTQVYETQVQHADGRPHDVLFHKAVFHEPSGRAGGVVGTMVDITERKRAEGALRASERKFRAIFDQTFQFVGMLEPDGTVLEINRTALDALGIDPSEVVGRRFWETPFWSHAPEERSRIRAAVGRAAEGEFQRFETTNLRLDGTSLHIDFSLKPARNEAGEVVFLIPEGRDITDRRRAEDELRAQKDLLGNVLTNIPYAVFWKDRDSVLQGGNERFARDCGLRSAEEVAGKTDYDLPWTTEQADFFRQCDAEVMEGGEPLLNIEEPQTQANGEIVTLLTSKVPLRDPAGRVTGILGLYTDITERKRMEEHARKLSRAIEASPALVMVTDPEGTIEYVNPRYQEVSGYSAQELVGGHAQQLGEQSDEDARAMWEALQRGEDWRGEFVNRKKSGEPYWESATISVVRDEAGQITHYVKVAEDITSRKVAEEALRAERNFSDAVVETAPVLILVMDREGRIVRFNRTCEELSGYRFEEVVGRRPWELFLHPGDARGAREAFETMLGGDFPIARKGMWVTRGGATRQIAWFNTVIPDPEGRPDYVVANGMDITERESAEKALRDSERRFRDVSNQFQTLLDGIPDSIMLLSPDLRIIWANRGTASLSSRDPWAEARPFCYEVWHERPGPCDGCPVLASFASGEVEEGVVTAADGRTLGVKAFPLVNEGGEVENVIFLGSDITEKYRLREEADRSSRLAALGELSAGVAHEINNPNGLIALNLPLIRQVFQDSLPILELHRRQSGDFALGGLDISRVEQELPVILEEMQECSQRIRRIVDDLKNFARSEGPEMEPFDLNVVIQAAVRLTGSSIRKASDRFEMSLGEDLPPVLGTAQRIEQVVVNLLLNACQALEERGAGVFVETSFDPGRGRVLLKVRDEGRGIARENLPRLTDPFFTTRREEGGTGLGLAVSARIVREHGGTLHFQSVPGGGTEVTVALPVCS